MASTIRVDNIQGTNGANYMVSGYNVRPGSIIETLTSSCDGSTVTVGSGSYTFQNPNGAQTLSDSFADVIGSVMSYTPPAGTTRVRYSYDFAWRYETAATIIHMGLYVDGTEITYARRNYAIEGSYPEFAGNYTYVIAIGGSDNFTTGRVANWNVSRTIKLMSRRYSSSYNGTLNASYNWNGSGQSLYFAPVLTIQAIA